MFMSTGDVVDFSQNIRIGQKCSNALKQNRVVNDVASADLISYNSERCISRI